MTDWIKPNRCSIGDCCEVRTFPNGWRWLRDSKHPEQEPLRFSPSEWAAFTAAVRAGQYDDEVPLGALPLPAKAVESMRTAVAAAVDAECALVAVGGDGGDE